VLLRIRSYGIQSLCSTFENLRYPISRKHHCISYIIYMSVTFSLLQQIRLTRRPSKILIPRSSSARLARAASCNPPTWCEQSNNCAEPYTGRVQARNSDRRTGDLLNTSLQTRRSTPFTPLKVPFLPIHDLISNQFYLPPAFSPRSRLACRQHTHLLLLLLLNMQFIVILSTLVAAASAAVAVPLVDPVQHVQSVAHHRPMPATNVHVPKLMARTGTRINSDDSHLTNSCNSEWPLTPIRR
jgi:hypothetical protein